MDISPEIRQAGRGIYRCSHRSGGLRGCSDCCRGRGHDALAGGFDDRSLELGEFGWYVTWSPGACFESTLPGSLGCDCFRDGTRTVWKTGSAKA